MMLLPYSKEPATGSRIPSISTGGAATKAKIYPVVAVNKVGIIKTPNQPIYKRLSVLVIQEQKRSHALALSRLSNVAVILYFYFKVIIVYFPNIYCVCYVNYPI
jgi:hypothetical protein